MFFKIGVLENFSIFTGKHLCWSLFLKETPTQVFSCEYCEFFKNNFFYRTPMVAASASARATVSDHRIISTFQFNTDTKETSNDII